MKKPVVHSKLSEVIRFLIAGGICFVIQTVLLIALRDGAGLNTLIAMPIAFLAAVVVNYILSVLWIWPSAREEDPFTKLVTRVGFLVTSAIGLLLNELFMWLFGLIFGENQVLFTVFGRNISMYMINTCITTVLVMFWNFFTKRAVLQSSLVRKWAAKWSERKSV